MGESVLRLLKEVQKKDYLLSIIVIFLLALFFIIYVAIKYTGA